MKNSIKLPPLVYIIIFDHLRRLDGYLFYYFLTYGRFIPIKFYGSLPLVHLRVVKISFSSGHNMNKIKGELAYIFTLIDNFYEKFKKVDLKMRKTTKHN